jgi:SARP family transcriptional regulator, regulator of embCAB operon
MELTEMQTNPFNKGCLVVGTKALSAFTSDGQLRFFSAENKVGLHRGRSLLNRITPPSGKRFYIVYMPMSSLMEKTAARIQLCGRLKADIEGRHVTPALRGRQGRVLLAYLVLNRGRPVSREELIDAIWPEKPPADPAAALRTQLSHLRNALGTDALAGRDTIELRLPEETWVDIEAAERAMRKAEVALQDQNWRDAWIQAHVSLNVGGRPFLSGFDAPWVTEVREDMAEMELRSREVIARAAIGLGGSELAVAERSARALIRAAPFRETGYLLLMQALVKAGNTAEAMRTYDNLRTMLNRELGTAPGAELQALHQDLLR